MSNILVLPVFLLSLLVAVGKAQDIPNLEGSIPACDGCYCVPGEGETCPGTRSSPFKLEGDQLELVNQKAENPYTLSCNPFLEANCQTTPPQEFVSLGQTAVCGIHFLLPKSLRLCPEKYKLQSYPSWEEAEADGAIVTHVGACGVCSTLEDLSALMSTKDLTPAVSKCVIKVTLFGINLPNIIECVQELGLTFECANLLSLMGVSLAGSCGLRCQNSVLGGSLPQGGPPECELNDCLKCTNEFVYPIYEAYAGRDTHRSAILAGYARPCSEEVDITHVVCPDFSSMAVSPTFTLAPVPERSSAPSITPEVTSSSSSSSSSSILFTAIVYNLLAISLAFGMFLIE